MTPQSLSDLQNTLRQWCIPKVNQDRGVTTAGEFAVAAIRWTYEISVIRVTVFFIDISGRYSPVVTKLNNMDVEPEIERAGSAFKSLVWKHFGFLKSDKSKVICLHCKAVLKYAGNTTNMAVHLKRHHPQYSSASSLPTSSSPKISPAKQKTHCYWRGKFYFHSWEYILQQNFIFSFWKHSKSVNVKYRDTVSYRQFGIAIVSRYVFSGDTQLYLLQNHLA